MTIKVHARCRIVEVELDDSIGAVMAPMCKATKTAVWGRPLQASAHRGVDDDGRAYTYVVPRGNEMSYTVYDDEIDDLVTVGTIDC